MVQGTVVPGFTQSRFLESVCVSNRVCIRVCDVMCNDMHVVLQRGEEVRVTHSRQSLGSNKKKQGKDGES